MAQIKDITKMKEEELREKFSLNQLKKRVKKLELVDDPDDFTTKGQLIQILHLAGKKRPSSPPGQEHKDKNRYERKRDEMKEILRNQPKVQVMLPLTGKEKAGTIVEQVNEQTGKLEEYRVGAWLPVTINGARSWVPKGKPVKVPRQVAELIGQYQSETSQALSRYLIEGDEKKEKALT